MKALKPEENQQKLELIEGFFQKNKWELTILKLSSTKSKKMKIQLLENIWNIKHIESYFISNDKIFLW